jgi:hypothetical protein
VHLPAHASSLPACLPAGLLKGSFELP